MTMCWDKLLCDFRVPSREGEPPHASAGEVFRSPFEADYDRVIFSPSFRRLSRKTQVHPMALNDHVHTRLTHSLEVAIVGRSLGRRLCRFLSQRQELPGNFCERDLCFILQAACLAHDIGNPPFGHAGEYAIREWVRTHPTEVFGAAGSGIPLALKNDCIYFEGNAQSFRIAARPDNPQPGYLRLTFATLGALVKYPWDSSDGRTHARPGHEKYNVFSSEAQLFEMVTAHTGMQLGDGRVVRHPLSFLTEAADDISYRILDLEDAVEMRILHEQRVRNIYCDLDPDADRAAPLSLLRGRAIGALINAAWSAFESDYAAIMEGARTRDLKSDFSPAHTAAMEQIKTLYTEIFGDRTKIAAELGAYKTLGRIIKALCQATQRLAEKRSFDDSGFLAQRTLELAWGIPYARQNQSQPYTWWLHQVLDYVSSLTDNYARQLSREIEGT